MSDPRDDLAALIHDTIRARYVHDDSPTDAAYINDDDPIDSVGVDGQVNLRAVADAIIAAGWRAPDPRACKSCIATTVINEIPVQLEEES